jgi:transketolase
MRVQLCDAMIARATNPDMLFITGDLGFMALEALQEKMGPRFINGGVAEQNIISVAAALARQDFETWVYSIAPFCYARPFEQIRNDIAFHKLPVHLIGNGGGYGYGVMGPTHHAIEDYGVLLTLPNFAVYVPVFDEDVADVVTLVASSGKPTYLRLGRGEPPKGYVTPSYAPWRQLTAGGGGVVLAVGPLAGTYIEAFEALPQQYRPNFWAIAQLPVETNPPPAELLAQISGAASLCIAEEHVAQGGFAAQFSLFLASRGIPIPKLTAMHAQAHIYERYGSQRFLREQSQLDVASILAAITPSAVRI